MLQSYIEELGLHPLLRRLKTIGGWPILEGEDWNEDVYSWWDAIIKVFQ